MSKTIAVNDDVYEMVKEFAKEDCRTVRQEASYMLKFAYKNMHNPTVAIASAMTPQKGMTEEEVRQSPKYKELEEQLAALKKDEWDLGDRDDLSMDEIVRLSNEYRDKQKEIQNQMRAMLNI